METYIVKVKSYYKNEPKEYGTGIIIATNLVITPKHVAVSGDNHTVCINDKEIKACVIEENDAIAVLKIEQKNYSVADVFSDDEVLDEESKWSVSGFISPQQLEHHLTGSGIIVSSEKEMEWDHCLVTINSGKTVDYRGLSGSPVFCGDRIVGILQMQAYNDSGAIGIFMSSVKLFRNLLAKENLKPNKYKTLLNEACNQYTQNQIKKNVKSRKYIADIFVEERNYKESLRYFADPMLFLRKAICDVKIINFESVNLHLRNIGEKEIYFSDLDENFTPAELEQVCFCTQERITDTIARIEEFEKNNSSTEKYYYIRQNSLNNSVKSYLSDIKDNIELITKKYVLLTKDAGQGKTNFVCDFTFNFLMKKDYYTLYFNAYEFRENQTVMDLIKQKLSLNYVYSYDYVNKILLRDWNRSKKPIVIIIDGLNENTLVECFGQCMRDFIEECQTYPYIKVIMTTRNEFLKERFAAIEEGTYFDLYKHIDMRQRDEDFKKRIFWGYLSFFGITIRKVTLTQKSYDSLTNDVLLLRFFCEVNENKKQIYLYNIYKYGVFRQYLDKKSLEYQNDQQVLNHRDFVDALFDMISEYMICNKVFFNVPSNIFNESEQKLLTKMLHNEVIFKDDQVIKTGMHKENTVVISFTFDEFRDFCITKYILKHYSEKHTFLSFWDQMNKENLTIREGVQKYTFYIAHAESQEDLLPIIQGLPEYEELYWSYIWDLEDRYFTVNDAESWKAQLLTNGPYAKLIVHDLIGKYNCDFFININIRLLFEVLDKLSHTIYLYESFTKWMFGVSRQKKEIYASPEPEYVCPFNKILKHIATHVDDNSWNVLHSELYRLTIYLLELEYKNALDLWRDLYVESPEVAVHILGEMNEHKSSLILCNVKEILQHLEKNRNGDEYSIQIKRLFQNNSFCWNTSIDTAQFIKLQFNEYGE